MCNFSKTKVQAKAATASAGVHFHLRKMAMNTAIHNTNMENITAAAYGPLLPCVRGFTA